MLVLEQVCKTYPGPEAAVTALKDASFEIGAGEFVAVQGPSGCGKSTLLLTCGALLSPDAGTVAIDGTNPYALSSNARSHFCAEQVGFVFQQFHLIPYLDALDNVLVPSVALRKPDRKTRAQELLERFGLKERARHVPAELSIGERQRVGLARALLNEPKLILADEPTGNLDTDSAEIVLQALTDYARRGGTVLMVTHSNEAAQRADRVLRMQQGGVRTEGEH